MAAIAHKLQDLWSDWSLELELWFARVFKTKPQTAEEKASGNATAKLPWSLRNLHLSDKARLFFYDQMATLIDSGVTLIDSLSLVQAQTKDKTTKLLYAELIHRVNTGASLAEAMGIFPHIFPPMQSALIEAGEKSGNLKLVLESLLDEMEGQQDFIRKITGAMFYPVILLVMAFAMVTGMMIFVIPRIAKMYESSHVTLPSLTQTVINISHFMSAYYGRLFISIFVVIFSLWYLFTKVRVGRLAWESFVAAIPVFGRISNEKNLMMISSNMGMLMQSGVLITDAFEITQKTVGNLHFQKAIADVRHGIALGRPISAMMGLEDIKAQKFTPNKFFPLQVAQLMHIGETTGTIAKMFYKLRDNYKKSIDFTLKNISTVIEPVMILLVASLVGSILMAVMLPFFYIGSTIH